MATEIPQQIEFSHLMAHTFPGFFSAFTLFMAIEVWSPFDITPLAIKDLNGLAAFAGFVLLMGTILGVIIDGIHHSLIEGALFNSLQGNDSIRNVLMKEPQDHFKDKYNIDMGLSSHYFFKELGERAIPIRQHLNNVAYSYSEFDSNAFLSLIPFSLVAPYFLLKVFHIPWKISVGFSILSLLLACFCLYRSYRAYVKYQVAWYSVIFGFKDR